MIPGKHPKHPNFRRSFLFAIQGFCSAIHQERNIRVMLVAGVIGCVLGFLVCFDALAWCIYILCCGCVISAELFNTSIEAVVDLVSPEFHPLAGKAKDIAAAAVWVLCLMVGVVGLGLYLRALGLL